MMCSRQGSTAIAVLTVAGLCTGFAPAGDVFDWEGYANGSLNGQTDPNTGQTWEKELFGQDGELIIDSTVASPLGGGIKSLRYDADGFQGPARLGIDLSVPVTSGIFLLRFDINNGPRTGGNNLIRFNILNRTIDGDGPDGNFDLPDDNDTAGTADITWQPYIQNGGGGQAAFNGFYGWDGQGLIGCSAMYDCNPCQEPPGGPANCPGDPLDGSIARRQIYCAPHPGNYNLPEGNWYRVRAYFDMDNNGRLLYATVHDINCGEEILVGERHPTKELVSLTAAGTATSVGVYSVQLRASGGDATGGQTFYLDNLEMGQVTGFVVPDPFDTPPPPPPPMRPTVVLDAQDEFTFPAPSLPVGDTPSMVLAGTELYTLDSSNLLTSWDTVAQPASSTYEAPAANLQFGNVSAVMTASVDCPCELTGDGVVNVFDLLAYLGLWFPGDPAADIDGMPGVDVFDLLAFLQCWFPASGGSCAGDSTVYAVANNFADVFPVGWRDVNSYRPGVDSDFQLAVSGDEFGGNTGDHSASLLLIEGEERILFAWRGATEYTSMATDFNSPLVVDRSLSGVGNRWAGATTEAFADGQVGSAMYYLQQTDEDGNAISNAQQGWQAIYLYDSTCVARSGAISPTRQTLPWVASCYDGGCVNAHTMEYVPSLNQVWVARASGTNEIGIYDIDDDTWGVVKIDRNGAPLNMDLVDLQLVGDRMFIMARGVDTVVSVGVNDVGSAPASPANDNCANAQPIGEETVPFDTTCTNTDGPSEGTLCSAFDVGQVNHDVWFLYTASGNGTATASTCGSSYDSKIAVYDAAGGCPTTESAIACNGDGTCPPQSDVSFAVTAGGTYYIRVGGWGAERGPGTLTVILGP